MQKSAVPAERSGVTLGFALRESRMALVTLVDRSGQALPLGSRVQREGSGMAPAIVGYDGQAYLEDLPVAVRLSVVTPGNEVCETRFEMPPAVSGIPNIGPLRCD